MEQAQVTEKSLVELAIEASLQRDEALRAERERHEAEFAAEFERNLQQREKSLREALARLEIPATVLGRGTGADPNSPLVFARVGDLPLGLYESQRNPEGLTASLIFDEPYTGLPDTDDPVFDDWWENAENRDLVRTWRVRNLADLGDVITEVEALLARRGGVEVKPWPPKPVEPPPASQEQRPRYAWLIDLQMNNSKRPFRILHSVYDVAKREIYTLVEFTD